MIKLWQAPTISFAIFIFRSPEHPELAEGDEWRLRKTNPAPILPY
jgi:hypothetical protein